MSNENEDDAPPAPLLEMPVTVDAPSANVEGFLGNENVASFLSRLSITEGFLTMLCRNCSYNEFLREILLAIMRVIKCEAGTLFELDHPARSLFFRAVVGRSSEQLGNFTIPLGKGVVGHVAESRQPAMLPTTTGDNLHLKTIDKAVDFETRNLIAVPIIIRTQVYGVIELINRVGEESFSTEDLELLVYIADMAAKTIEVRMMLAWGWKKAAGAAA